VLENQDEKPTKPGAGFPYLVLGALLAVATTAAVTGKSIRMPTTKMINPLINWWWMNVP
jgi:hypothetical protein